MVENSFNIVLLDCYENFITFLNSNRCNIVETCSTSAHRNIKLVYPMDDNDVQKYSKWFKHGNKIYIPSTLGLDNCLYVINTEYTIDYWQDNNITVEAEEVLVELNYASFANYILDEDTSPEVNKTNLENWFGNFYEIGTVDELDTAKKIVNVNGNMSLMDLYNLIQDSTERIFVTEYAHDGSKITRKLHLLKESSLREKANTEFLDLNYNLDSLELVKDESNSFVALAPKLKINNNNSVESPSFSASSVGKVGASISSSNIVTNVASLTPEDAKTIYDAWVNLNVEYREYIPMIIQKKDNMGDEYEIKAYWYAPFIKKEGTDYIYSPNQSNVDYNCIIPYASKTDIVNPIMKKGFVETSEVHPMAIYNVLANSLLTKTRSTFKLKVSVKDIQLLLGKSNLGYKLYETLYVLPPGFDYYVPCYVTKTVKNPHMAGENTITLETDVTGTHSQQDTEILAEDEIFYIDSDETKVGGQLITANGQPVANAVVSINIRLDKSYTSVENKTEEILEFKPNEQSYVFTEEEIQKLEQKMRYDLIVNQDVSEQYVMKAITNKKYSVPYYWCSSIYNTRNQAYINSDFPTGMGKFRKSITVQYIEGTDETLKWKDNILEYPSFFYDLMNKVYTENVKLGANYNYLPVVSSSDEQTGNGCVPCAVSNASALLCNYKTESQLRKIFKTDTNGTSLNNILPGLKEAGFDYSIHNITENNIKQFIKANSVALLICNPVSLGLQVEGEMHCLTVYDWIEKDGVMKVGLMDSANPVFSPLHVGKYDVTMNGWYDVETLVKAVSITENNGILSRTNDNTLKKMIVLSNNSSTLPQIQTEEIVSMGIFDPSKYSYLVTIPKLKQVYKELYNNIKLKPNVIPTSLNYTVRGENNRSFDIPGEWVVALAYTMFWYYQTHYEEANFMISANKTSNSGKYYKALQDVYGITPMDSSLKDNIEHQFVLSCILFYRGYLLPPVKFELVNMSTETQNIFISNGATYNFYKNAIQDYANDLNCYIVDFSWNNLKKYTAFEDYDRSGVTFRSSTNISLVLLYLADNEVGDWLTSNYEGKGYYVVFSHTNDVVRGVLPLAKSYNPIDNTSGESAWIKSVEGVETKNDTTEHKNKMLVISPFTLEELEQKYIERGQK